MMKKISAVVIGSLGLVALASGCAVDAVESEEFLGTDQEAACSNDQSTNAIIAAMAVAAANELKRWLPMRDLEWNHSTGQLQLSQYGRARCPIVGYDSAGKAIKNCEVLNELLALQKPEAAGMNFGGSTLNDPGVLRSRLYSYWDRQVVCSSRPDNGRGDDCPVEAHDLKFDRYEISQSTCAGSKDFWYHAYYMGTTTNLNSTDAAQLKNQLLWAGGTSNPFLTFDNVGANVKIDPLDGTTGGDSSGSGSTDVAANAVWKETPAPARWVCDATNVNKTIGAACTCNGLNRTWQKKPLMNGWFVCI